MEAYKIKLEFVISDEETLRSHYSELSPLAAKKCLSALDKHARDFIARSPFLCLGTQNKDGKADVSPRGDPVGFVKVLDPQTLAIPDRPGNNRLDSLANIVANPNVGLLFLVPGFDETLRVNGRATLVTDPDLLQTMSVKDRAPKLAIVVKVSEVFLHCAKAFRRSHFWDPEHQQDRSEMPSLSKIILDQTTGAPDEKEMQKLDAALEETYRQTLY
ncbi:pyridoxamine 5'-phosphate oxidase family protein [Labrenzia sp. R5_0]|jgi:PPOX class probable FMN-dependent enzyme|uniref:pyridoxamine 5'-phosphate oxidase family protein n=1 Tax=Labrenzia sp. R5_0 TaxID=2821108 RepID=UPI001ADC7F33|nr:pyridoxamine 5'-phosphate oxidase family protein [Labrenzia sp. R5_0]MBO9461762.1 pyridoxamine 5'-phosphate oxidase family protein [Labrenzia sp. R5_0]